MNQQGDPPAGFGLGASLLDVPDRRDGMAYVMPDNAKLAVRVALATGRPLLLRGEPGSGKSSLAAHVALERNWRYYEYIVTSRTAAQDLLWGFDSIRRLADAQLGRKLDDYRYVEPGVLWWTFARESAYQRGRLAGGSIQPADEPNADINAARSADNAIVLIDEIDKADPDLPNGLLVPLGSNEFRVRETGTTIRIQPPRQPTTAQTESRTLIVVTTNEERELPQAFLRRCVVIWLEHPNRDQLVAIARRHFEVHEGGMNADDELLATRLAALIVDLRQQAERAAVRQPSTAEFLDALRACRHLGIAVGGAEWAQIETMLLVKRQQPK